jgi:dienelactone hydrolase
MVRAPHAALHAGVPRGRVTAVALIAHGGKSQDTRPATRLQPAALRMYPFFRRLRRHGRQHGLAVAQLRYRVVGFNEGDPVEDVRWALDALAERYGGPPVCVVGHSMGARAGLRAAGHPTVAAVVGLAPWLPASEPVEQVAARTIVLVHGTRDRVTDPAGSLRFALEAREVADRCCRFEVARSGHAMLKRASLWHTLTCEAVLGSLGLVPLSGRLARAFAAPSEEAARIRL